MNGFYETFIICLAPPGSKWGRYCSTLFRLRKGGNGNTAQNEKKDLKVIHWFGYFCRSTIFGWCRSISSEILSWSNWFNIRDDCNHLSVGLCSRKGTKEKMRRKKAAKKYPLLSYRTVQWTEFITNFKAIYPFLYLWETRHSWSMISIYAMMCSPLTQFQSSSPPPQN